MVPILGLEVGSRGETSYSLLGPTFQMPKTLLIAQGKLQQQQQQQQRQQRQQHHGSRITEK
ncbi:hypothetical protein ACSSS7_002713 [Eimeria intestinalis]